MQCWFLLDYALVHANGDDKYHINTFAWKFTRHELLSLHNHYELILYIYVYMYVSMYVYICVWYVCMRAGIRACVHVPKIF